MKLDKYIQVWNSVFADTSDGGSTETLELYWRGWARVDEKAYSTVMQSGQWVGNKESKFIIRKNEITELINETCSIEYRSRMYEVESVSEIDPFYLAILAKESKKLQEL